jgi:O-succinylhomoserine sulfhydrylase
MNTPDKAHSQTPSQEGGQGHPRDSEAARIARARLPAGLRPETLAVRTALAPSQHGENSEALFLTSTFIQPDAQTSARRFAQMEDFTYARTSNPTVRSLEQRLAAMEAELKRRDEGQ